MSDTVKVPHVGKVTVYGGSVIKEYVQSVAGSAWKKAGTDILLLHAAGFDNIIIRMNQDHPNKKDLLKVAKSASDLIPTITLETITEVK